MDPDTATRHLANAWEHVLGTPASEYTLALLWAQWALETARGDKMMAYNFAGLKGKAPGGHSAMWWTCEGPRPDCKRVLRRFRAYATPEEGAEDYVRVLRDRFRSAFVAARYGNVADFVRGLDSRGFFTADARVYAWAMSSLAREFLRNDMGRVAGRQSSTTEASSPSAAM